MGALLGPATQYIRPGYPWQQTSWILEDSRKQRTPPVPGIMDTMVERW